MGIDNWARGRVGRVVLMGGGDVLIDWDKFLKGTLRTRIEYRWFCQFAFLFFWARIVDLFAANRDKNPVVAPELRR